METTAKFKRFPPISGVTFSGNEKTAIKSRLSIEEEIKDSINYCKKESEGVAARFILGDWGEGKTDTYERIIEPYITNSGDYLFFLSASRLANSYENETIMNFAKFLLANPDRLLIHLFNVIKADSKYNDLIPEMKENPKSFLSRTLDKLLNNNDKKIFIFIDEFEELLLSPKTLKKVVSGIKESINGDFEVESLGKDGEYKDRLHFFLSCTPDAYYKIQVNYDFIMPGFDRRVGKIRLTQITREEGLKFLMDLINYSYTSNDGDSPTLPNNLPISNISVFNTLLRVSQRNMGNLTSLFTEIFKSLVVDDQIEILNYSNLIDQLKRHEITAYGGQTPCIDNNYDRVIKYLEESCSTQNQEICKEIFRLIIGELKPNSLNYISQIISEDNLSAQNLIKNINQEIKENDKIENAIIKVAPLSATNNLEDLLNKLSKEKYIKENKTFYIQKIKFSEPIEDFKERIISYELNEKNNLIPKVYLPIDKEDTKAFFEGLIEDDEEAILLSGIFKEFVEDEYAYLANESLLNLIYPTPIPLDTAYLTNEEEKLKLWRYLSHNLNEEYEKNILEAFYLFMEKSKIFEINEQINSRIQLIVPETNTKINTKILLVNGDVEPNHINEASAILSKDLATNLVLILHNGEFTEQAYDELYDQKLGQNDKYQVMGIQLHHSLAKKLLFGLKALQKFEKYIDKDLFEGVCQEKIEELNLKSKINTWIDYQIKKGLVINQIKLKNARDPKTFADGLKLYLNYDGSHTPDEIHSLNMDGVLLFKRYGSKGFIASDFEDGSGEITKVSLDLANNGFLIESGDKYTVTTNPVEDRIFEFIKNAGGKLSLNDLKSYFIIRDRNERAFQDVFINIMDYKGIIRSRPKNDIIEINSIDSAFEDLNKLYSEYKNNVNDDEFRRFGHYYIKKQRASKLIVFDEFDEFITSTFKEAESSNDLLKINICTKILKHFNNNFLIAIQEASKAAPTLMKEINEIKSELDESIDDVINRSVMWLKYNFKRNDIVEYKGLLEDFDDLNNLYLENYSKEDLLNKIDDIEMKFKRQYPDEYAKKMLEIFGFNKDNSTPPYFNIKIYLLKEKMEKISEKASEIKDSLDKLCTKFEEIETRQNELEERLEKTKKTVNEKNKLAFYMFKQLEEANINHKPDVKTSSEIIDLSSLLKSSEDSIKKIGDRISLVITFTNLIENINDAEKDFLKTLHQKKEDYIIYEKIGDTKNFQDDIKFFKDKINQLEVNYEEIDMNELRKDVKKRKTLVKDLNSWTHTLDIASDAISSEWEDYQKNNREYVYKIQTQLDILKSDEFSEDQEALIKYGVKKLIQYSKVDMLNSEFTASKLDSMRENLNNDVMEIITKILPPNVRDLLLNLKSIHSEWITFEEIESIAKEKLGMDQKSLDESVNILIDKGYIKRGLSLTL
ncbi:hypothetical protein [Methanobacterium sp. BAmetb5]|uniref:hypothetical protein n=1 Tax=Methanobacterium sp. BAmetb5 TaxID=2025351 RepID=UPI000E9B9BEB|nr:hypothetical protein [Methanobacterium sp. BAmetb5]AXV39089.1 MAG: hypothetical protein CIT02_01550 [Methanobacterium sp. BAmetb5]